MSQPATNNISSLYRPRLSSEGLPPTCLVGATDEFRATRELRIAGEFPLTIKVDGTEVVTLMTLGTYPEKLTLGYLRNQRLIEDIHEISEIHVNWEQETANVRTSHGAGFAELQEKISRQTITSNSSKGTTLDKLYDNQLSRVEICQSNIYAVLNNISRFNDIYRTAGAVHGCALCQESDILCFVEDIGRHNATDTVAGEMWLEGINGNDKWFYTTGRLTSEIVMKATNMGIRILLSRSGITSMGLELAQDLGVTLIARAKGRHFLVYNGEDTVIYNAIPDRRTDDTKISR